MLTIDGPPKKKGPPWFRQALIVRIALGEDRHCGACWSIDRGVQPVRFCEWEASVAGQEEHELHATINFQA